MLASTVSQCWLDRDRCNCIGRFRCAQYRILVSQGKRRNSKVEMPFRTDTSRYSMGVNGYKYRPS